MSGQRCSAERWISALELLLHRKSEILLEYKEAQSRQLGIKWPWLFVRLEGGQDKKAVCPYTRPVKRERGRTGLATSQGERPGGCDLTTTLK